jgi:uncharacterized protein
MEKEQKIVNNTIQRNELLDAMRGYFIAWVGIFNTIHILNAVYPNMVYSAVLLFINDKGWFCLSAIFGYSFGLLLKKETKQPLLFPKRMLVLFLVGVANSFLWYGDILKDYALIGILVYLFRKQLIAYKKLILLALLLLTLLSIVLIDNDMSKVGTFTDYMARSRNNVLFANFEYNISLYFHSSYFLIAYHLQMLLLVAIGFYGSLLGIKSTYLWVFDQAKKNLKLYLFVDLLMLCSFLVLTTYGYCSINYIFYFGHIAFFALWYMTGFYLVINKWAWLSKFLSKIGKKTLTLYICQNLLLCSFWLLHDTTNGLWRNTVLFLGLQLLLIVGASLSKTNWIETCYRSLATKL